MTFDTTNWEIEANRVAAAFGVEPPCEFLEFDSEQRLLYLQRASSRIYIRGSLYFSTLYSRGGRLFSVTKGYSWAAEIFIRWDGSVDRRPWFFAHNPLLARALFHLELLTPEVEEALNIIVSTHERLEWELEYQGRFEMLSRNVI